MSLELKGDGTDSLRLDGTARYGIGYAGKPGSFAWVRLTPGAAALLREVFTQIPTDEEA